MSWLKAPTFHEIAAVFRDLPDPGYTVMNCVLQKSGVHDLRTASEYLEMATTIGAANVSFIGMFMANAYCKEQYVSPETLNVRIDERFSVWNRFSDHDYCSCLTGNYQAKSRYIRFYYRCPGTAVPSYCRQLVYESNNQLRQGFGGEAVKLDY